MQRQSAATVGSCMGRRARFTLHCAMGLCLFLLLGGLQTSSWSMEHVDLPLDHWAYTLLERFEVRASLERTGLESRPLRRGQVARLVTRLEASWRHGDWTPTAIERQQLHMLRQELGDEGFFRSVELPVKQFVRIEAKIKIGKIIGYLKAFEKGQ